jgi:hypothetical protein
MRELPAWPAPSRERSSARLGGCHARGLGGPYPGRIELMPTGDGRTGQRTFSTRSAPDKLRMRLDPLRFVVCLLIILVVSRLHQYVPALAKCVLCSS